MGSSNDADQSATTNGQRTRAAVGVDLDGDERVRRELELAGEPLEQRQAHPHDDHRRRKVPRAVEEVVLPAKLDAVGGVAPGGLTLVLFGLEIQIEAHAEQQEAGEERGQPREEPAEAAPPREAAGGTAMP